MADGLAGRDGVAGLDAVAVALCLSVVLYVVGVLWFALGARRRRRIAEVEPAQPTVAVVVAARDEATHVEACLRALGAQTYPATRWEVVLVDDGSVDDTGERARRVAQTLVGRGLQVRVLDGPAAYGDAGGKKAALTLAIAASGGEVILTTDADCDIPATWVASMAASFTDDVGAVIGFSQIGAPGARMGPLAAWEGLDFLQLMTAAAGSCAHGHPMAASGQNLGFRRHAFDEVGGYARIRQRVSGDDVLLMQLIRNSDRWRVAFCDDPGSYIQHPPSPSLRSFLSRRSRWASNAPSQLRLDPLFFVYMLITFGVALGLSISPWLWLTGRLGADQVALAWGGKAAADLALAWVGARRFGRLDLLRAFLPWVLLHPFYAALVGAVGPFGFFRWKRRRVALGRQPSRGATGSATELH